jgi:hypothetical protein
MRDHDQTTKERTGYIKDVYRGDPNWHLHLYQVFSDDADSKELLSEHWTKDDAEDALHRYVDPKLT